MSAITKGKQSATLIKSEPVFDADAQTYAFDVTYMGNQAAILGLEAGFQDEGFSYEIQQDGGVFYLHGRVPQSDPVDHYEIFTESTEQSLFQQPHVAEVAKAYDDSIAVGAQTWRSLTEEAVTTKSLHGATPFTVEYDVVNALRNGVTGFQVDFITLRRVRRVKRLFAYASTGKLNLDIGLFIYQTDHLGVPADVAFVLPTVTLPVTDQYLWGWRRRNQSVEYVGQWIEQKIELTFAPWSLIPYQATTDFLNW